MHLCKYSIVQCSPYLHTIVMNIHEVYSGLVLHVCFIVTLSNALVCVVKTRLLLPSVYMK